MEYMADEVPVDVDIFYRMWKSQARVRIPQTIVYRFGKIDSWFFNATHEKGETPLVLQKRPFTIRQTGIAERIIQAMAGNAKPNDLVAIWVGGEPSAPSVVLHLTKQHLSLFLTQVPDKGHGVLQRFVKPFGGHNGIYRAERTPHHFAIDYKVNWYTTSDQRVKMSDRLATFEGGVRHVSEGAVNKHVHDAVESSCLRLVNAMDTMLRPSKKVWRMVVNFKQDEHGTFWLCYCSRYDV
jgi:hypothetical protein